MKLGRADAERIVGRTGWLAERPEAFRSAVLRREYSCLASSGIAAVMPVRMGPGQMQLTVMPSLPSSTASERVRPTTPCLAAV